MSGSDRAAKDVTTDRVSEGTNHPTEAIKSAAVPASDWKPIVDQGRGANDPIHPEIAGKKDATVVAASSTETVTQTTTPEVVAKGEVKVVSTLGADTQFEKTRDVTTHVHHGRTESTVAVAQGEGAAPVDGNKLNNPGSGVLEGQALADAQAAAVAGDKGAQGALIKAGLAKPEDFQNSGDTTVASNTPGGTERVAQSNSGELEDLTQKTGSEATARVLLARNQSDDLDQQTGRRRQA